MSTIPSLGAKEDIKRQRIKAGVYLNRSEILNIIKKELLELK